MLVVSCYWFRYFDIGLGVGILAQLSRHWSRCPHIGLCVWMLLTWVFRHQILAQVSRYWFGNPDVMLCVHLSKGTNIRKLVQVCECVVLTWGIDEDALMLVQMSGYQIVLILVRVAVYCSRCPDISSGVLIGLVSRY